MLLTSGLARVALGKSTWASAYQGGMFRQAEHHRCGIAVVHHAQCNESCICMVVRVDSGMLCRVPWSTCVGQAPFHACELGCKREKVSGPGLRSQISMQPDQDQLKLRSSWVVLKPWVFVPASVLEMDYASLHLHSIHLSTWPVVHIFHHDASGCST